MTATILGEGAAMITGVPPIIAADRWSLIHMGATANRGTNVITRKGRKRNDARIGVESIVQSPATTGGFSEPEKNKQHLWRPSQPRS